MGLLSILKLYACTVFTRTTSCMLKLYWCGLGTKVILRQKVGRNMLSLSPAHNQGKLLDCELGMSKGCIIFSMLTGQQRCDACSRAPPFQCARAHAQTDSSGGCYLGVPHPSFHIWRTSPGSILGVEVASSCSRGN